MNPFDSIRFQPYWWDAAPRPPSDGPGPPATADVVVIGTGFTGVSAALTLARAGRNVVGLDAADIGFGASTRNGGQIGPGNQKFTVGELVDRFGRDRALALYREGDAMLAHLKRVVREENIDCNLQECGRFRGAVTPGHYDAMARELEAARQFAGVEGFTVSRRDLPDEIDSGAYSGGVVLSRDGSVHPGRLHTGLAARAREAGARFFGNTPARRYRRERDALAVDTARGEIRARDVILATNGYPGSFDSPLKRKIVPVASAIIATEPLPEARIDALLPGGRVYGETRRVFSYFRASPDGKRVLFGGRCFSMRHDHLPAYAALYKSMVRILPGLRGVRITHGWSGCVGMSRDQFPHIGTQDGIHFTLGYSGTGVTRSVYFGHKIALRVLGDPRSATQFEDIEFADHAPAARQRLAVNAYVRWLQCRDLIDQWFRTR